MMDFIESDFGVKPISSADEATLYAGVDDLFIHLVFYGSSGGINRVEQTYVHEFELANAYQKLINPTLNESYIQLCNNHRLSIQYENDHIQLVWHWTDPDVTFLIKHSAINFNVYLQSVIEIVKHIAEAFEKKHGYRQTLLKKLLGKQSYVQKLFNNLSKDDMDMIAYEIEVLKSKKRWNKAHGLYSIFQIYLTGNHDLPERMKNNFLDKFDYVVSTDSCDCGSPGCFFDILKANQLHFFPDANVSDYSTSGLTQFEKLWDSLQPRQKSLLLYLDNSFSNTPMLNLAFLRPDFNINYYQYLMCFQEQPDSEEERYVRVISTTAHYFNVIN